MRNKRRRTSKDDLYPKLIKDPFAGGTTWFPKLARLYEAVQKEPWFTQGHKVVIPGTNYMQVMEPYKPPQHAPLPKGGHVPTVWKKVHIEWDLKKDRYEITPAPVRHIKIKRRASKTTTGALSRVKAILDELDSDAGARWQSEMEQERKIQNLAIGRNKLIAALELEGRVRKVPNNYDWELAVVRHRPVVGNDRINLNFHLAGTNDTKPDAHVETITINAPLTPDEAKEVLDLVKGAIGVVTARLKGNE